MKMFFLTPSGALALPANRSDSEFAGAGLARILLMLALLLSNWKAYAAIGVSSIAPTSAAEIKISSCGVDVTGTAKDYYNNTLPWGVAGTLNTAIDVVTGIGHTPAAIGHLGEGTGTFSADPSWQNLPGVVSDALVVGSVLSVTASALPSLNGSAAAAATPKSADTIAEGMRVSPYRVTGSGETYIRYESANPAFSKVTPTGGVKPGTFAAPASDGLVPIGQRASTYNLPNPEILRPNATTLAPPAGTPIIGPRPVSGGTGNEVIFWMGY